jgi:hypothetical protein
VYQQAIEKKSTGTSAGHGEEEHRYTIRPRRREGQVHQQAKGKRSTGTPSGQGEKEHRCTSRLRGR